MAPSERSRLTPMGLVHASLGVFLVLWLLNGVGHTIAASYPASIKLGALAAWFALAAVRHSTYVKSATPIIMPTLLLLGLTTLLGSNLDDSGQNLQGLIYLVISLGLGCFYAAQRFWAEATILLAVAGVDFAVTGYRTLVALVQEPVLARYLAITEKQRVAEFPNVDFSGLGGYPFAYSLAAIFIVAASYDWRPERRIWRWIICIPAGVVVVQMGFTTAILLSVAIPVGFRIIHVLNPGAKALVGAAIVLGWGMGFFSWIFESLARMMWLQEAVRIRMGEMADATSPAGSLEEGADLGIRIELWTKSIDATLQGGLFGLLGSTGPHAEIGEHSHWLDSAATFGIFAALPLISFFAFYRFLNREADLPQQRMHRELFSYMIILGTINTLFFSMILITWAVLAPILIRWPSRASQNAATAELAVQR